MASISNDIVQGQILVLAILLQIEDNSAEINVT